VQGLAALAVHEPGRSFDADVVAMTAAAGHTRHGAVTRARERAWTMAGPCEPGDVLGVIEGDFVVVGAELDDVVREVVTRLLSGGGELLTLVTGEGAPPGLAAAVEAAVVATRPEIDTVVYDGGQTRYPLLVAVE
jgi:dihydroxyacetone kinase-like predicted kinase